MKLHISAMVSTASAYQTVVVSIVLCVRTLREATKACWGLLHAFLSDPLLK